MKLRVTEPGNSEPRNSAGIGSTGSRRSIRSTGSNNSNGSSQMRTNDIRVIKVSFEHFNITMEGEVHRVELQTPSGDIEETFVAYFKAYDARNTSSIHGTVPEALNWVYEKSLEVRRADMEPTPHDNDTTTEELEPQWSIGVGSDEEIEG